MRQLVGGPEVLRGQLEHLLAMSKLDNIVLRALTFSAGAHPGFNGSSPEEVADVVTFLLSQRASWINGTNVCVDGAQGRPSSSAW